MRGGEKARWTRRNRQMILSVAEARGSDFACKAFQIAPGKLEELALDELKADFSWSKSDKALLTAKVAEAGVAEIKDKLAEYEPVMQIVREIVNIIGDYAVKQAEQEAQRQALLRVPGTDEPLQLTHESHNLVVMSGESCLINKNHTPPLNFERTDFKVCPLVFPPVGGRDPRQRITTGKKKSRRSTQ